jgi:hypothetical protein
MLGCGCLEARRHFAKQGDLFLNDLVWHEEEKGG